MGSKTIESVLKEIYAEIDHLSDIDDLPKELYISIGKLQMLRKIDENGDIALTAESSSQKSQPSNSTCIAKPKGAKVSKVSKPKANEKKPKADEEKPKPAKRSYTKIDKADETKNVLRIIRDNKFKPVSIQFMIDSLKKNYIAVVRILDEMVENKILDKEKVKLEGHKIAQWLYSISPDMPDEIKQIKLDEETPTNGTEHPEPEKHPDAAKSSEEKKDDVTIEV